MIKLINLPVCLSFVYSRNERVQIFSSLKQVDGILEQTSKLYLMFSILNTALKSYSFFLILNTAFFGLVANYCYKLFNKPFDFMPQKRWVRRDFKVAFHTHIGNKIFISNSTKSRYIIRSKNLEKTIILPKQFYNHYIFLLVTTLTQNVKKII